MRGDILAPASIIESYERATMCQQFWKKIGRKNIWGSHCIRKDIQGDDWPYREVTESPLDAALCGASRERLLAGLRLKAVL